MTFKHRKKIINILIVFCVIVGLLSSFGCSTDNVKTQVDLPAASSAEIDTEIADGKIELPDVSGYKLDETLTILEQRGFTNVWRYSIDDEGIYDGFENWQVVSQSIDPYTLIDPDEQIVLTCEWVQPVETTAPYIETTTQYVEPTAAEIPVTHTYVLNTNTKKIHTTTCRSVSQMKDSNKLYVEGTLDEIFSWYPGYTVCGNCYARY